MKTLGLMFALLFIFGCNSSSENYDNKVTENIHLDMPIIVFHANGGQFEDGEITKPGQLVMLGSRQEAAVNKGFMFSHWNSEKDGSGESMTFINSPRYASVEGSEDVMMYAQWTPLDRDFNLVFEAMIPGDLIILKNLSKGSVINLPGNNDYTNTGYILSGWVDDLNSPVLYTDTYIVEKTVTLFAVWRKQ